MSLSWDRFDAVAEPLALQGFNTIPLPPEAKGCAGSGILFRHLNKRDSRRVTSLDRAQWETTFRRKGFEGPVGAYLLPSSNPSWAYAIVDVDDPAMDGRAVELFGDSPLRVSRGGRVRHRYFRTQNPRAAHLIGAFGKRSVDIIATTGVVLPGSVHADGDPYELSVPFDEWTEAWVKANVPEIDLSIVADLRTQRRGTLKIDLSSHTPVQGEAAGFLHAADPLDFGESVWCGHVLPGTLIQTVDGPVPMAKVANGTKCFATYREDSHPSAHVSDYRGRRYFWDMSQAPKRYWTMVENLDAQTDPEQGLQDLPSALQERLGVGVEVVHDDGWLADQIGLIEDDQTVFLIAPHGSGKTILARREHERARTSISVCNTQALTIANASVLGLRPVYEGVDPEPKGSACIPSLHRYDSPPEFFHVDEADAVHGFLHAGKIDEPLLAWRTLAFFAALSKRSLFASADLSFEDVALFVHAIRERNVARKIKVVLRLPMRDRGTVRIRPVSVAKEAIHAAVQAKHGPCEFQVEDESPHNCKEAEGTKDRSNWCDACKAAAPVFVGITTRKLAGQIAQGYRSASALESIDLDEIATSAVDNPQPHPLDLGDLPPANVDSAFFVSGENNRYHAAVRWLEDTDKLVDSHDLIVTSPAVQSGVSLDRPVSKVVVLHENREVPADAVLQILRRCRNPQDRDLIIGVRKWTAQAHRTDRPFLDDLARKKARTTVRAVLSSFPEFQEDHETPVDAEFAWSWRITARKSIRSYADPVGAVVAAAKRHGFEVDLDLEADGDGSQFNEVARAAKELRDTLNAEETADAEDVDPETRAKLERSARLMEGERQELDKATLLAFYGMTVDAALVLLDNRGKYRAKVRRYVHARLLVEAPDVVAYADHLRSKGRQISESSSLFASAALMVDLFQAVLGVPLDGEPVEFSTNAARSKVAAWWKKHRQTCAVFFPRMRGPAPDKEVRWLGDRLRSMGAEVETFGKNSNRKKRLTWDRVDGFSVAYAERLFESHEQSESEKWRKEWSKKVS